MFSTAMQWFSDFFGVDTTIETDSEIYEEVHEEVPRADKQQRKSKVVSINNTVAGSPSIEILQPATFEEAGEVVTHIQNHKIVLLKIDLLPHDEARRVVDYASGAAIALLGEIRKLSTDIFVINPNGVNVAGDDYKKEFAETAAIYKFNF